MRKLLDKKEVLDRLSYWANEAETTDDNAQYKKVRSDTFREARIIIEDEVPVINESDLLNKVKYKKPVILKKTDIETQPVKRGHWYDNTYRYVGELDAYFIQACCSCCNRYSDKLDRYTKIMSNETCSHCGADMRGEDDG